MMANLEMSMRADKGWRESLAENSFFLTVVGIVVFLMLMVWLSAAMAAERSAQDAFPFEEKDCGTIGNVLVIAGHARDMGKPEADFKKEAAEALKECQQENGVDGCSVRNEAQQRTVDGMFDFLWQHPTADGTDFATEFYHMCQARLAT